MNSTATGPTATLFGEAPAPTAPQPGLVPATARLVTTHSTDMADPELRDLLLLVVLCPYCDQQHVHPAGHTGAFTFGVRRSRCVGRQGGSYYFPGLVHQ
ncbi:hypothetical protein [Streptomyces sp. H27-C3]|uniref:hypothetical protein n=1 Tax=Streptomyces sp. H27-C3 TaxID=3046305 RepID=UPI0024BA2597|nr:hypothetical protein [Streptomyces sp. H27-C3]MDJ0461584.1 hypothetical protein [Streptomyces sp. H27-C3]